jgi:voltage-gated potassium channel Kch
MKQTFLSGLLFVGVLLGGTLGFWLAGDGWTIFDAFYMTVISVTTVGYGEVRELTNAGRIVAISVLFAGLGIFGFVISQITSFIVSGELGGLFARKRLRERVRKIANHVIVCGLGKRGAWIARSFTLKGTESLSAIELDPNVSAVTDLRNAGVVVEVGNANNVKNIEQIGLNTASHIVVVAGSDEENLAIAKEVYKAVRNLDTPPLIVAGVERYETRSYFSDRLGVLGISLISFRSEAALRLAHQLMIEWIRVRKDIPALPLRIYIQTADCFRDEIVRAFVMTCQLTAKICPEVHVFQASLEAKSRFSDSFPAVSECAKLFWYDRTLETTAILDDLPDFAIFAMDSDTESLYAAERYLMRRPTLAPDRVVAFIQDTGDLREAALQTDPFKRQPKVLSSYEVHIEVGSLLSPTMESEGRAIHEAYRIEAMNNNQDPGAWETLPEFLRQSNRLAAMHKPIKEFFYNQLKANGVDEVEIVKHLTICEHQRWVAFHVMNGWRPSPITIADRRVRSETRCHHSIRAFDDLDNDTKLFNRKNVLQALGLETPI